MTGGNLDDRQKWQPLKVVCIQSNSQGARHKRLIAACRELDFLIAKIFGIKLDS